MDEAKEHDIDPTDNLAPGQGVLPFDELFSDRPVLTPEPSDDDVSMSELRENEEDVDSTVELEEADSVTAPQADGEVDASTEVDAQDAEGSADEAELDAEPRDLAASDTNFGEPDDGPSAEPDEPALSAADEEPVDAATGDVEPPEAVTSAPAAPVIAPIKVDVDTLDLSDPESIPALDRPRPFRPPVVPLWVSYTSVALIVALIVGIGGYLWWSSRATVNTPIVIGLTEDRATETLESLGLVVEVAERRFSTQPKGQVLEQDPTGGASLKRGDVVSLVVSAGSEEFVMPDVVGDRLAQAQATLEDRGLIVNVTTVESGEASDTVLSSVPGPGESVRTGDVVRLTVSKPAPDGGGLKPYSLQGVRILLDPAPVLNSATDPAMDVSRRLRALLEAAGATVATTRAASDPPTLPEADRAARAKEASASVAIGLSVAESGAAGRVVLFPGSGRPEVVTGSERLASALTSGLAQAVAPAASTSGGSDAVLTGSDAVWARIRVGSLTAREDQTAFADPTWADKVARAIYTAIGQLYGLEASSQ